MVWTVSFFENKQATWKKYRDTVIEGSDAAGGSTAPSVHAGLVAYAERQMDHWEEMARGADSSFVSVFPGYRSLR
jgi:hypothetical protein